MSAVALARHDKPFPTASTVNWSSKGHKTLQAKIQKHLTYFHRNGRNARRAGFFRAQAPPPSRAERRRLPRVRRPPARRPPAGRPPVRRPLARLAPKEREERESQSARGRRLGSLLPPKEKEALVAVEDGRRPIRCCRGGPCSSHHEGGSRRVVVEISVSSLLLWSLTALPCTNAE